MAVAQVAERSTASLAEPGRPPAAELGASSRRSIGALLRSAVIAPRLQVTTPSPFAKQRQALMAFALALAIMPTLSRMPVEDAGLFTASLILLGAATVLSIGLTVGRVEPDGWWERTVPAVDLVVVEMLRESTGGSRSMFGVLLLVPTIWLATGPGRRSVLLATLGVAVVFLLPYALTPALVATDPDGLRRGVFTTGAFSIGAVIINRRGRRTRSRFDAVQAQEQLIERELNRGGEVQQALLPKHGALVEGYRIAGSCLPARTVGGDFYDWYRVEEGLGFTLGDVMGKGVGAGMIAATTRAVVRSARGHGDPVVALERADACLVSELDEANVFATMFHGRLRSADGLVSYADAGHGLTLHIRSDGSWERLGSENLPVGLGLPGFWTTRAVRLDPGDMLVTFSDGVLDLYADTDEALAAVASAAVAAASPSDLVEALRSRSADDNADDITVLALQRQPLSA